jgi:hypothetical protein
MRRKGKPMIKPSSLALAVVMGLFAAAPSRAADLDTLAKYLGFIGSFQDILETCRAEAKLPDPQIKSAWDHITERRALIFAGLNETDRQKIAADAGPKKAQMLDGFTRSLGKDQPGKSLPELCRTDGFFAGILDAETKAQVKETAAIRKAKS